MSGLSRTEQVIVFLSANGPSRNSEIADELYTHSGDIARMMSKLTHRGIVRRVDGGQGRGHKATYALCS